MDKIKVLRIFNRFIVGGPITNAIILSRDLADPFETLLIGGVAEGDEKSSLEEVLKNDIRLKVITSLCRRPHIFKDIKSYYEIKRIIKEYDPDVVHTHGSKTGFLGRLAAAKMKVPVIVHTYHGHVFHSYFSKVISSLYVNIERFIGKKTDKVITLSRSQQEDIVEKFSIVDKSKSEIIPLAIDVKNLDGIELIEKNFRKLYNVGEEVVTIGIIGRLVPIKNIEMFIRSLSLLKKELSSGWQAFIIGDGSERTSLEDLSRSLGMTDQIIFTSWITPPLKALAPIDIVCLSSHNEGTPLSLIEAASLGKAIVSTDVGGVGDVFLHHENALIIEKGNHLEFSKALKQLVLNQGLRKELGKQAMIMAQEKFHSKRLVQDIHHLYLELLDKKQNQ